MPDLLERLRAALTDRYVVESEIGRGGMAVVFLAEDLKHGRNVAIKVLHPELAATVGGDRFLREIEIAANLDHPHILPLHDSGEANGLLYYVMPYVEGESLRDRLAREQQLPIDEAVRIAREVADGLGYAHRNGVIHRDIKPANIMLSEGHALIADFGVARAIGGEGQALTSTGLAVGTPAYMSPEQASGGDAGAGSDLYALGCVLYEMLAGEPPLTGPSPQATAAKRLTETATALPVLRETVPGGVDRVTRKLLAKAAADRYSTSERLIEALDDPGLWAAAKPERRSPKRIVGVALGLVLLALTVGAAQWLLGPDGGSSVEILPERVAVLPFENRTGDPSLDALAEGAAERISTRLQQDGAGEIVPVSLVRSSLSAVPGEDPAGTVAEATGAGLLITGFITGTAEEVEFAVRIRDAATGSQVGSLNVPAANTGPPDSALRVFASRLSGGLLLAFSGDYHSSAWKTYPLVEAYRLFREASGLHSDLEREEALDLYFAASRMDPTFSLPLGVAQGAALDLGRYDTVDSLYTLIEERFRPRMTEVERNQFDAGRAEFDGDLEAASRYQRRVVSAAPVDGIYWQNMALLCFATNRPREPSKA